MAGTGTLCLSGQVFGSVTSQGAAKPLSFSPIATASVIDQESLVSLTTGDNAITIPTGTTAIVVVPPASNTVALAVGVAGAVILHPTNWFVFSPRSGSTSFILNAASAVTVTVRFL